MYKFLQFVGFFQVVFCCKSSFSLFSPIPVVFSPTVHVVPQYCIDFCPLIVCPCMRFCSAWSLCLWSWWILHGGHVHRVIHKARRCDGGRKGHNRHCKYSAVGLCINSTDMKCICSSCWNVILTFLLRASGWLDCVTFENSYLLQLSSLQAAVWLEYMGECILFVFLMEYFILMDKIIHEKNFSL